MRLFWLAIACCLPLKAMAAVQPADVWQRVGFEQRLNTQVPLALQFRDEQGRQVHLSDYFGKKPVILVLGYYSCKNLCSVVMDGLLASLGQISFVAGNEFEIVAVSIDPHETSTLAAMKKTHYLEAYARSGAAGGLHLLTGNRPAIERLSRNVGFRYFYDANIKQYVHTAGITVFTPAGRIARYFYGVHYRPRDVRLGLIEASTNRIGSVVDQLLLLCAHYDPATGKYGYAIWNTLRGACLVTALALGGFILAMVRRERRGQTSRSYGNQ
jgi:protein SCO1/2